MAERSYPVFNLSLEFEDWQNPKDISDLLFKARLASPFEKFITSCNVHNTGKLFSIKVPGLHTYRGDINLFEDDHVHLFNLGCSQEFSTPGIKNTDDGIYLDINPDRQPIYTLDGLYANKIRLQEPNGALTFLAIADEIKKHGRVESGEYLEELSLGELKDVYRERISDQ